MFLAMPRRLNASARAFKHSAGDCAPLSKITASMSLFGRYIPVANEPWTSNRDCGHIESTAARTRSTAAAEGREGRPFPRASDADGPAATHDDLSTTATLRAQLEASRRKVAEVMAASAAKDSALAEARDDLRRDEAIFAEKMREIKALKKEVKAAAKAGVRASVSETVDGAFPLTPSSAPRGRAKDEERADGSLPPLALPGSLPATPLEGPGARAPVSDASAADSEKRSLVRQKAEIELERAQLRREAATRARAYQQEKKSLERQLRELARNIGSKEKLIVDLTRNEREASLLTRRYENKVRSLEEEKASKEAEAARLRSELRVHVERAARETERTEKSSENARASAEARDFEKTRLVYERKVRAAETEARALRLAKAESDALRANTEALGTREQNDKTRELETEVSKMRADAEALRRRLRERDASYAAFSLQKATDAKATDAEVADLRRTRDAQSAKIDALASSESRHLEALRRATDELAAAKATIRRLGGEEDAERRTFVADAAAGDSEANDFEKVRALVDAETTKALARRAREEERTRLRTKRDLLLGEKRDLFARRDALLARRARAAEKLEAERATLVVAANAFARESRGGSPSSVTEAPSKKETETLARLGFVRDALASGENVLSAEDARELRDAEDRADSVDAELDFLAAKLAELAELDRMFSPNDASVVPFGVERGDRGDRAVHRRRRRHARRRAARDAARGRAEGHRGDGEREPHARDGVRPPGHRAQARARAQGSRAPFAERARGHGGGRTRETGGSDRGGRFASRRRRRHRRRRGGDEATQRGTARSRVPARARARRARERWTGSGRQARAVLAGGADVARARRASRDVPRERSRNRHRRSPIRRVV